MKFIYSNQFIPWLGSHQYRTEPASFQYVWVLAHLQVLTILVVLKAEMTTHLERGSPESVEATTFKASSMHSQGFATGEINGGGTFSHL